MISNNFLNSLNNQRQLTIKTSSKLIKSAENSSRSTRKSKLSSKKSRKPSATFPCSILISAHSHAVEIWTFSNAMLGSNKKPPLLWYLSLSRSPFQQEQPFQLSEKDKKNIFLSKGRKFSEIFEWQRWMKATASSAKRFQGISKAISLIWWMELRNFSKWFIKKS